MSKKRSSRRRHAPGPPHRGQQPKQSAAQSPQGASQPPQSVAPPAQGGTAPKQSLVPSSPGALPAPPAQGAAPPSPGAGPTATPARTAPAAGSAHATYVQILRRPEVVALAERFGLARGVRYELVGERRSFNGKAQTTNGAHLVRLPANARPEPFLLLTLLHEWAHLLVHKRSGQRRVPPHGSAWRKEYLTLAQAAVEAGLFPGNETEVLRHAASGEATTRRAALRGADGELLVPPPERPAARFARGDAVRFLLRGGESVAGTVRRVNPRSYTVVSTDGTRIYRVPLDYRWLEAEGAPLPTPPAASPWRVGMKVRFPDATGRTLAGTVVRVNQKTLTVDASDGVRYRVGYGYAGLRAVEG